MSTAEQRLRQFPPRKNKYPAVPPAGTTLESLQIAVERIKERVEQFARERGDALDSFLSVQDAINLDLLDIEGQAKAKSIATAIAAATSNWGLVSTAASTTAAINGYYDCDATAAPIIITLPSPAGLEGKSIVVSKADASINTVTVSGAINGGASAVINSQHTTLLFVSVGYEWRVS